MKYFTAPLITLVLVGSLSAAACDAASCTATAEQALDTAKPTLESVLARADAQKLLECAALPTSKAAAKCLGAEALTKGLEVALERATELAEQARDAANPAAGAADMDADQRDALAADLEASLEVLGREIDATKPHA